ncbi:hypothetical protein GJ689_04020 [Rhodoplanes serenus]|uniref:Uncharacterized protein n=1 Tax=Rhodoplanes serenus TaxID=200615 RepID=A0A9X4XMU7_9BRAD|nr:hypothetical protein [Rhodoplanes serenus]MTW15371.1 hypothetical protein [Rhodoplanes serenus]
MSTLAYDDLPQKPESTGSAFGSLARFYASFYEAQIGQAKRVLDYYRNLLNGLGGQREADYHSFVVGSAIEAPDAQARARAVRYTAGGYAPTE